MTDRFAGKVAVVTGAAAGFGLAVSLRLAAEGARVVLVDRAADPLAEAAAAIEDSLPVVADVSQAGDVESYVQAAVARYGQVDLFFNNAGIEGRMAPMTELSVDDFDRVWAVNARGVFMGLRAVLKVMKPQGSGVIVNVTTMVAGFGKNVTSRLTVKLNVTVPVSPAASVAVTVIW